MNTLTDRRLAQIGPHELAAFKRGAHLDRSRAARELVASAFGWLSNVVREAGCAARLSEAPRPYRAPRSRSCG
jgi:hypothetical protein